MNTTPAELETLQKLADASQKCFGLDLYNAYKTLPQAHIRSLVDQGLWFQLSSTQGNLTAAGVELLRDKWERENHQAIVDLLVADAQAVGLTVKMIGTIGGADEAFEVTSWTRGLLTLDRAQFALFLVEERLCKAGKIR